MPSPRLSIPAAPLRRLLVTAVVVLGALGGSAVALDRLAGPATNAAGPDAASRVGPPAGAGLPAPTQSSATKAPQVLAAPGEFPTDGPGEFRFAGREGDVLGESGPLRRFRVAVEEGVDEDPEAFGEFVDATLGHRQGWTASGELRLQRVPGDAGHDFTIYLATTATAAELCATAGLDVVGGGLPDGGVSCETGGRVVLNLSRWRLSVPEYVAAEVPLEVYRQMLVNHEVGHWLGHGHEGCPGRGEPAPVMQQQSLSLDGCEPNPWPYLDGERHTGPRVP